MLKPEEEPLDLLFPRKGPIDTCPQGMNSVVAQPLAPTLGALAVAWIVFDVGDQARIEDALAIGGGIKARVEIEISASEG